MEEIAVGVTPAMDSTPAGDPFMQQLIAEKNRLLDENNRLRARNITLEYRLERYERTYSDILAYRLASHGYTYDDIAAIMQQHDSEKGVEG